MWHEPVEDVEDKTQTSCKTMLKREPGACGGLGVGGGCQPRTDISARIYPLLVAPQQILYDAFTVRHEEERT
jgi:hypothetical protein